jgi:hypothetical protein|tara:strand:+ start:403 stop:759 length:357 start_codon:yes stop_codon:yes gene_type:complete
MATNSNWTVVFEDKSIIKNCDEFADPNDGRGYIIDDEAFWADSAFSNIWAIQAGADNPSDEVEHRDDTPHCSLADEGIDIQQFIDKWDAAHLVQLQEDWDADSREESEKGPRPTSYSS